MFSLKRNVKKKKNNKHTKRPQLLVDMLSLIKNVRTQNTLDLVGKQGVQDIGSSTVLSCVLVKSNVFLLFLLHLLEVTLFIFFPSSSGDVTVTHHTSIKGKKVPICLTGT